MATALDIIKRSMRLVQIISSGEDPVAADAQDALSALNRMMHGFPSQGIEYIHATLSGLTSEINLPDAHLECLEYMLAARLAPEFERSLSDDVKDMAESSMRFLQGVYVKIPTVGVDAGLLDMPSQGVNTGWESITNG